MAVRPLNGLALCAGAGGLELGLGLALGDAYRAVGYVERDAYAAATLVARMEDASLAPAPIWDDLSTFDGHPWRGRVDLVSAGFPCQPFSDAGERRGLDDERWLWPDVARVVDEVGPDFVFVENVRGFLAGHGGLGAVLGDLADLGFDAEWSLLSAAAVGAPHRRERFWLLAHRDGCRLPQLGGQPGHDGHPWDDADRPGGSYVADAGGPRHGALARSAHGDAGEHGPDRADIAERRGAAVEDAYRLGRAVGAWASLRTRHGHEPADAGLHLADTHGIGQSGRTTPWAHGRRPGPPDGRCELADAQGSGHEGQGLRGLAPGGGLWPPRPDDRDGWAAAGRAGLPQPSVRRVADGLAHRLDRLHATGNGVVPLVAAHAFLGLARRAGLLDGGGLR